MHEYGGYNEIAYLLSEGDLLKLDDIFLKSAHQCIYWAEYLIRKRKVEAADLD